MSEISTPIYDSINFFSLFESYSYLIKNVSSIVPLLSVFTFATVATWIHAVRVRRALPNKKIIKNLVIIFDNYIILR